MSHRQEGDVGTTPEAREPTAHDVDGGDRDPSGLAIELLEDVRSGEIVQPSLQRLERLDHADLSPIRVDRRAGLAFWLNLYNGAAQLLLDRQPALFESRWRFFRTEAITVAGVALSLDDIEHGLLRGGRSKYGLGYLPRLARTGLDRDYRLTADPRVHFALNCGAASCPVIRVYEPQHVDEQLDRATAAHLRSTGEGDGDSKRILVPRFCLWYIGDFGGYTGLRSFVRDYANLPDDVKPAVRFASHDWSKVPGQFANS